MLCSLLLLAPALVVLAEPASACGTRTLGGVQRGDLGSGGSDWYQIVIAGAVLVVVIPDQGSTADAYLYGRDQCTTYGSSGTNAGSLPEILGAAGGPVGVFNVQVVGTGPYTIALLAAPGFLPGLSTGGGQCAFYNDFHRNGNQEQDEEGVLVPCPAIAPRLQPGANCHAWNDSNNNGAEDAGEGLITAPCPGSPGLQVNNDGSCTVYRDLNGDGDMDVGEAVTTVLCPDPRVRYAGDTVTVYNDRDHDATLDDGERLTSVSHPPLG